MGNISKTELDSKALALKSIVDEYYSQKLRLNELNKMTRPFTLLAHSEDCDDDYQEALEINWEKSDIRDNMSELSKKATEIICYFITNEYFNALKAWANLYSNNLVNFISERKFK